MNAISALPVADRFPTLSLPRVRTSSAVAVAVFAAGMAVLMELAWISFQSVGMEGQEVWVSHVRNLIVGATAVSATFLVSAFALLWRAVGSARS